MKVISRLFILLIACNSGFSWTMEQPDEQEPAGLLQVVPAEDMPDAAPQPGEAVLVPAQQQAEENEEESCPICLEDMQNKVAPEVVTLDCHHKFCTNCIARIEKHPGNLWAMDLPHFTCPICRARFTGNDIKRIQEAYKNFNHLQASILTRKAIDATITIAALGLGLYGAYHLYNEPLPVQLDTIQNQNPVQRARNLAWSVYKAILGVYDGWYFSRGIQISGIIDAVYDGDDEIRSIQNNTPINADAYNQRAVNIYTSARRVSNIFGHCALMYFGMKRVKGYVNYLWAVDNLPSIFN